MTATAKMTDNSVTQAAIMDFFRGLMIAMPISLILWVLIVVLAYLAFQSLAPAGDVPAAV
ncbi:hypothetical protein Q3C01_34555 [Bradyrhizobium sp. UFLA05-109]